MAMITCSDSTLSTQRNCGRQAYYPIPAIGYSETSFPLQSPESKTHTLPKKMNQGLDRRAPYPPFQYLEQYNSNLTLSMFL